MFKINIFSMEDEILRKDDDQSIVNELLQLCSWWSESENFANSFIFTIIFLLEIYKFF